MPLVSIDQCIPILRREISRLDSFLAQHREGGYSEPIAAALWGHLFDVIAQVQNVAGPVQQPEVDRIMALLRPIGAVAGPHEPLSAQS